MREEDSHLYEEQRIQKEIEKQGKVAKTVKVIAVFVVLLLLIAAAILILATATNRHEKMKPVIYLYPEETTEVSVKLETDGKLTATYPEYGNGWRVTAEPDGTLTDADGQKYNYLYWESTSMEKVEFEEGFCVKGSETAAFLEKALADLGLTRREANEFIVYWLPMMKSNPYNVIRFCGSDYTDSTRLLISPKPDTVIRVFMVWYGSKKPVTIRRQTLSAPVRKGFTVVEWGGSRIRKSLRLWNNRRWH